MPLRRWLLLTCLACGLTHAAAPPGPTQMPQRDSARGLANTLVPWATADGTYGFADRTGVLRIPARFTAARPFHEGLAAVATKEGWGFVRPDGEFQIAPRYAFVGDFLDGKAKAYRHREPVMSPLGAWVGAALVSGRTTEFILDPRGSVLRESSRSESVLQIPTAADRRFERHPEPDISADRAGWQVELLPGGGDALKRGSDGQRITWARWMMIIRDATTGAPVLFAGHDDNQPWRVWRPDGQRIAADLMAVHPYAHEGHFCAMGGKYGWWAGFDEQGRRVTPFLGQKPFFFRDGIAEVEAPQGATLYVDVDGRVYADAKFLEKIQAPWRDAPASNPYWRGEDR